MRWSSRLELGLATSGIVLAALMAFPSAVLARPGMHTLRLEGTGALMVTDPQASRFDFGGGVAAGYELRFIPYLGAEVRFSTAFFPSTPAAPTVDGYGSFLAPGLGLRLHPLPDLDAGDLWIGVGGDVVITGEVVRPGLEVGVGFEVDVAWWLRLGPFVRYVHTFELDGAPGASSAGFLQFGLSVALLGEEPVQEEESVVPAPGDLDGDGLLDPVDQCPREPEDADNFEDADGCPDPDNDQDGIPDAEDGCPNAPEDQDGFEDTDGCPDPDNDADGVLDASDRCPLEPEDRDGFEDADGCPDPDNDRDGIPDAEDRCPLDPGQPNTAQPERHGCPHNIDVNRGSGEIVILQRVEFATSLDRILESSQPTLDDVVSVLAANASLRVRVEGHTDDRGPDRRNLELSRQRARSVLRNLAARGIGIDRLTGFGCGELHPREPNATRAGRQTNRRVEFHIVDPPPAAGPRDLPGCLEVTRAEAAGR